MKIVSCYQAAKTSGVSKQRISNMKKANVDNKGSYPFFGFDRETGKFGVDVEHPSWIEYLGNRQSTGLLSPGKENQSKDNTSRQSNTDENDQNTAFKHLAESYLTAAIKTFNPPEKKLSQFKELAIEIFKARIGE